jgi:hypothetical protein
MVDSSRNSIAIKNLVGNTNFCGTAI